MRAKKELRSGTLGRARKKKKKANLSAVVVGGEVEGVKVELHQQILTYNMHCTAVMSSLIPF